MNNTITFDSGKCTRCGLCAKVCSINYLKQEGNALPTAENREMCFHCGHCLAACPKNAITHTGLQDKEFLHAEDHEITKDKMIEFLSIRRSCRVYKDTKVDSMLLKEIIDTAQGAPSTFNSQDRGFVVIDNPEKIDEFRRLMVEETKKHIGLANFMLSKFMSLFLNKESVSYFKRMRYDMIVTLDKFEAGEDSFFHNAPCLVLFTGIGLDTFGKDHALGGMHYFMDIAQASGLGTCILGHVMASKKANTLVSLPPMHTILGAITVGYPAVKYAKTIHREAKLVEFVS